MCGWRRATGRLMPPACSVVPRVPRVTVSRRVSRVRGRALFCVHPSQGRTWYSQLGGVGVRVYLSCIYTSPDGFTIFVFPHASRSRLRLFPQGSRARGDLDSRAVSRENPRSMWRGFTDSGSDTGLCASHLGSSPPRRVWPCDGYIPCRCRLQPSSRGPLGAVLGSRLWLMRPSHFECSRLDAHPSATVVVDRVDRAGDRRRRRPLDGRLLGWAAQRLPPWRWCIRSGGLSDETSHLGVRYASRSDLAPRIDAKTELRRRRW